MPNLVHGHLRFTEEDYLHTDFYEKIRTDIKNKSVPQLLYDFNNMKIENIGKNELKKKFIAFAQLACANGYTITDLIK